MLTQKIRIAFTFDKRKHDDSCYQKYRKFPSPNCLEIFCIHHKARKLTVWLKPLAQHKAHKFTLWLKPLAQHKAHKLTLWLKPLAQHKAHKLI